MQQVSARPSGRRQYQFGPYRLDLEERRLWRDGDTVPLTSRVFDILAVLVANSGRPIDKDEIIRKVWPDSIVEEGNLTRNVSTLRKVLGDSPEDHQYIITLPGRGYQFVQPVQEVLQGESGEAERPAFSGPLEEIDRGVDEPHAKEVLIAKRVGRRIYVIGALFLAALSAVLAWLTLQPSREAIDSLVVLPLANGNADPQTEYLSDGITETLINNLSQLPDLRVIARTTAFRYRGREAELQKVGQELNVRAALTGRVLQRGDTLIVQADLVDVADGSQLWGQQYNRKLADIFAVQEEISQEITEKLRLRLSSREQKQLTKRYTANSEAYQLYLKGRYHWNRRTPQSLNKGIEYFRQAIDKDPNYALPYTGLADSYSNLGSAVGGFSPQETFPKAKEAALKALEIDDTLAETHAALALISMRYDWDWLTTEREIKRAIELNPNYTATYHFYSDYLAMRGQMDEAVAVIKRGQELDPLSLVINTIAGIRLCYAREYDRAIEQCQKTLELDPNYARAYFALGLAYGQKRRHEEAIAALKKAITLSPDNPFDVSALGHAYALSGQAAEARKILQQLQELSQRRYVSPHEMAIIHAGLGEQHQAFRRLDEAYADRSWRLPFLKADPRFDGLRSDPRFTGLLRRMGLQQ